MSGLSDNDSYTADSTNHTEMQKTCRKLEKENKELTKKERISQKYKETSKSAI